MLLFVQFSYLLITSSVLLPPQDYMRFADMLTMESPLSRLRGLRFKATVDTNDIKLIQDKLRNEFDRVQLVLKQVPTFMLLVFRYTYWPFFN